MSSTREKGFYNDGTNLVIRPPVTGGRLYMESIPMASFQIKTHNGYTGSEANRQTFAVSTTDATVTTIATIPTATDYAYAINALVVGKKAAAADGLAARLLSGVTNNGGALAEVAAENVTTLENSAGTPAVTLTTSGTNILLQVTGIAAENWAWVASVEWVAVKTSA